jgi:hypothetical protein
MCVEQSVNQLRFQQRGLELNSKFNTREVNRVTGYKVHACTEGTDNINKMK